MELRGSRTLPVNPQIAWDALNDPEVLRASIDGCEELERISDTEFRAAITAAVGPVKARFRARLTLVDVVAPNSYTIRFDGQGGVAGFAKGEARVLLTPEGQDATRLDYDTKASVGGKLAQLGSRLADAAAKKSAADFFARFDHELERRHPRAPATGAPAAAQQESAGAAAKAGTKGSGRRIAIVLVLIAAVAAIGFMLYRLR